jgi:hypothetical protein
MGAAHLIASQPIREPWRQLRIGVSSRKEDSSMPSTTVASGTFPSRRAADQAIQRLVSSGFARNSIELHRHDDDEGYDLEVHTRAENLRRVQGLIDSSAPLYSARQMASGAVRTAGAHPLILLGAGVLAGFVIYNLIPRGQDNGHQQDHRSGRSSHGSRHRRHQSRSQHR